MEETRRSDPVVRLLTALVVLVALLVVGLGLGGFYVLHQLSKVRAAVRGSSGQDLTALRDTMKRSADLLEEATRRQDALAESLGARAGKSVDELHALQRRRDMLAGVQKGPIDKMGQMVQLNQLMSDEMMLLLDHLTSTQAAVAKAVRPLPTQRQLQAPGTGGAGKAGEGASSKGKASTGKGGAGKAGQEPSPSH